MLHIDIKYKNTNCYAYVFDVDFTLDNEFDYIELKSEIRQVNDDNIYLAITYLISLLKEEYEQYGEKLDFIVYLPSKYNLTKYDKDIIGLDLFIDFSNLYYYCTNVCFN